MPIMHLAKTMLSAAVVGHCRKDLRIWHDRIHLYGKFIFLNIYLRTNKVEFIMHHKS